MTKGDSTAIERTEPGEQGAGSGSKKGLVNLGQQRALAVFAEQVLVKVSSHDTQGRFVACEIQVNARSATQARSHQYEDQWFYVLEGHFQFESDGIRTAVPSGAVVYVARNTPYRYCNTDPATGRLLVLAVPGGLDVFCAEISEPRHGSPRQRSELLERILEKHGVRLLDASAAATPGGGDDSD